MFHLLPVVLCVADVFVEDDVDTSLLGLCLSSDAVLVIPLPGKGSLSGHVRPWTSGWLLNSPLVLRIHRLIVKKSI